MNDKIYDLAIIGAGPAGLAASIYAARYNLCFLLVGKLSLSAIAKSDKIENYPGVRSIKGADLINDWKIQAQSLGAEIVENTIFDIENCRGLFKLFLENGENVVCKNIILATGTVKNKLGAVGEAEFAGKGVSYCATCDAPFFKDKVVVVAGGGDSAAKAALHLASFAKKVFIIYRRDKLKAEPIWLEKIKLEKKIEVIYNTNITQIKGGKIVEKLVLDKPYKDSCELNASGVFVEIGAKPNSILAETLGVELDEDGYIKVNADGSTNIQGAYAAGDATNGSNKMQQIITAAAEGALAAASVYGRIKKEAR